MRERRKGREEKWGKKVRREEERTEEREENSRAVFFLNTRERKKILK